MYINNIHMDWIIIELWLLISKLTNLKTFWYYVCCLYAKFSQRLMDWSKASFNLLTFLESVIISHSLTLVIWQTLSSRIRWENCSSKMRFSNSCSYSFRYIENSLRHTMLNECMWNYINRFHDAFQQMIWKRFQKWSLNETFRSVFWVGIDFSKIFESVDTNL